MSAALAAVGNAWADEARAIAPPEASAHGIAGIRFEQESVTSGALVVPKVAYFADKGTNPHTIVPRNTSFLRFQPKGQTGFVFAKRVNHPGTAAKPFLQRSWESARVQRAKAQAIGDIFHQG